MKLSFFGAARQVTGSMFLLETQSQYKILVDCGEDFESRNQNGFPFDPSEIDLVILTHAHLDHTGRLPALYLEGYEGQVICTSPTCHLTGLILNDAATLKSKNLQRKLRRVKHGGRKVADDQKVLTAVEEAADRFVPLEFNRRFEITPDIFLTLFPAGHLLGAAFVYLEIFDEDQWKKICFSGDIGRKGYPLLPDPAVIPEVDYLVCESTYGSRVHEETEDPEEILYSVIKKTCVDIPGRLIIPSFSVGRTQALLFTLNKLSVEKRLPPITIFADSPMAELCTRIYEKHTGHLNEEAKKFLQNNELFNFENLISVASSKESKAVSGHSEPCIILSSSGMITGGRIQQHIKRNLNNQYCTILLVGYCAEGTIGNSLYSREKYIMVKGKPVQVRANILNTDIFSGHGDKNDLLEFVRQQNSEKLSRIFLVHGEEESMIALKETLGEEGYNQVEIPEKGEVFQL
jgi:metallo-beta-lactamase family protein